MATAKDFTFSGGAWLTDGGTGYTPIVDDNYGASGSYEVWRWDIQYQNSRYVPGSAHWLQYTKSTGEWKAVGGGANVVGTRNGNIITCGSYAIFNETDAFTGGTVPTAPSAPNVTSITSGYIVTNDTVSNTDFILLKNGSSYANTNISLTAATITLPSDAQVAGYTYNLNYNGTAVYSRTINSLSHHGFFWDDSWTSSPTSGRSTSSNRILNVLATIPSNIRIGSGSDSNGNPNPLTTVFNNVSRVITHTLTATIDGVSNEIYINFALDNKVINGVSEIIGTFYESRASDGYTNVSQDYIIGNQQTMTYNQSLLGDTITYYVSDWVYSDQPEGDGYVDPVSTTSNGGGKPDRYPLIMTNLFNRNRSIYSIGMTHKDTWDLFL